MKRDHQSSERARRALPGGRARRRARLMLLDGAHLVAEALAARRPIADVLVSSEAADRATTSGRSSTASNAPAADVVVGLRAGDGAPSARCDRRAPIVALAERPRPAGERLYAGTAAGRRSPATCRIPATSARSCGWPKPPARPGWSPPARCADPVRLEGAARIDGQRAAAADRRRSSIEPRRGRRSAAARLPHRGDGAARRRRRCSTST